MSARGRGPDSTLVHMSPREVEGLQKLAVANGTSLTINPDTGLPEAFSLKDLLPTLAGAAINYFAPGFGTAIGGALGLSGAAGTGLAVGAATAALSGDLGKGLSAGLGAYGGAGISEGLMGLGTGALSAEAGKAAIPSGMDALGYEAEQLSQNAIASKLAGSGKFDTLSAGASKAMSDPMSAVKALGGGSTGKGLALAAAALSPLLAGETGNTVQTVTKRPSTAMIRPYRYDNMSQTFEEGPPYAAANGGLMQLENRNAKRYNGIGGSLVGGGGFAPPDFNDVSETAQAARKTFADQFVKDNENNASLVAAQGLYGDVLDRKAESPEVLQNWATKFGSTIDDSERDIFRAAAAPETSTRANQQNYTPISGLNALYQSELGRPGEQAGMDFWKKTFGDYIDPTELAGFKAEAAKERAARPVVVNPIVETPIVETPTVVTDLTTADKKYIAPGVGGSTGAGQEGGGTVINPNGSITTSPRIPGIPVGGFSGMTDVKRTYTDSGGDLGYTSYAPKTIDEFNKKYTNTGSQKEMYDYLMGKGDRPTKTKNADGTFREISRPYNEAVLGVPGSTNKRLTWNKEKGEYFRNPDYVHTARAPILDAAGKQKRDADGNYLYNTTTYKSINQAKAGIADNKLTKDSGSALFDWATTSNVDEQTVADALGIPLQEVIGIFAKVKADKKIPAKNGGLMRLAHGGVAYDKGGGVKADYVDSKGETHVWDWENGMYRPQTLLKNNKSYTWDKASNNYKLAGADAGIAGLMDMSGGSNAGDARGPGTDNTGTGQTFYGGLANLAGEAQRLGFTTVGNFLGGLVPEGAEYNRVDLDTGNTVKGALTAADIAALSGKSDKGSSVSLGGTNTGDNEGVNTNTGATGMNTGTTGGSPAQAGDIGNPGGPGDTKGDAPGQDHSGEANGGMVGRYAQGGLGSLGGYSDGGRLLRGPGDGVSDSIPASIGDRQPARLANNEFVIPARIVSEIGNGSTDAGARRLYQMMDRIQKARKKSMGKGNIAVDSKAYLHLPA